MDSSSVAALSAQNVVADASLKTAPLNPDRPLGEIRAPSDTALAGRVMMGNVVPGNPISIHTVVETIRPREKSFPVRMGKNGKLEAVPEEGEESASESGAVESKNRNDEA